MSPVAAAAGPSTAQSHRSLMPRLAVLLAKPASVDLERRTAYTYIDMYRCIYIYIYMRVYVDVYIYIYEHVHGPEKLA